MEHRDSRPMDLETDNEELIHDMQFDFYGKRLATCSSDLTVKIYDYSKKKEVLYNF